MEGMLQMLESIYPLSEDAGYAILEKTKYKELPKKATLLRAGHICQHIYFIQKGLLRCFYYQSEHEVSSWFMLEGDIIISVESFYRQIASYESIQALEDCELFYMDYRDLQQIYRNYPEFNFVGRVLTERYYSLSEQRLYSMRMMRAKERYEYMTTHHPELVKRVPAKFLASYLGISEVMLSIIKNR